MGAYTEMDIEMQYDEDVPFDCDDPFADEDCIAEPEQLVVTDAAAALQTEVQTQSDVGPNTRNKPREEAPDEPADTTGEDEDAKRQAHEEAEAKRKAEWDARQQAKKSALQEQLDRLATMSDDEVMMASTQRISADTERLTRRNMKECVSEHIQTLCLDDPAFSRKAMHPRKSMIHCIWYINRKAKEYAEQEMKDNGFKPENGVYGCDVPDDLCYKWAEEYFNDLNAKEDEEPEEKFVPRPYPGGRAKPKGKQKKEKPKKEPAKKPDVKPEPKPDDEEQMSLLGAAG